MVLESIREFGDHKGESVRKWIVIYEKHLSRLNVLRHVESVRR